ncbi:hypothetical protein B566_EDAN006172, partial [Ephemera danica]
MQFYFRQFWTDERLRFESKDVGSEKSEMISIRSDLVPKLWVPDTFFVNEKQAQKHSVPNENGFVRIHHSGAVTQSMRLSVTAICPMNLQYFPMDLQQCHLEIEIGYSMNDIRYKWKDGPNSVGISNDVALPQFSVLGYRQRSIEISLSTVEILIARSVGAYQLQTYIPASSFVILSWVSFWINPTATTTRVLIGLINNLLIILLCIATNAYLPKISYVKALDFVVVHYLLNNKKRNEEHAAMSAENDEEVAKPAESNRNKIISRLQPVIKKLKTTNIDFWSPITTDLGSASSLTSSSCDSCLAGRLGSSDLVSLVSSFFLGMERVSSITGSSTFFTASNAAWNLLQLA